MRWRTESLNAGFLPGFRHLAAKRSQSATACARSLPRAPRTRSTPAAARGDSSAQIRRTIPARGLRATGRAAGRRAEGRRRETCWSGSSRSAGRRPGCVRRMSTASSAPRMPATRSPGLSGGLIFLDGWFAQVLEGAPGPALDACLARIARDPRHRGIERRSRERALCRLFPGQAMALRTRACLDPALLEAFGWRPGFPVADFPADVLVEFVVQACHARPPPRRPRRRAPGGLLKPRAIASIAGGFGLKRWRGPAPARRLRVRPGCAEGVAREGHGGLLRRRALGADAPHPAGLRGVRPSSSSGSSPAADPALGAVRYYPVGNVSRQEPAGGSRRARRQLRRIVARRAAGLAVTTGAGPGLMALGAGQARSAAAARSGSIRSPTPSGCRSRAGWRGGSPTPGWPSGSTSPGPGGPDYWGAVL